MRLQEFQKAPQEAVRAPVAAPGGIPGQMTVEECIAEVEDESQLVDGPEHPRGCRCDLCLEVERLAAIPPGSLAEPQYEKATSPSGLEIYYQWAPKRLYRIRRDDPSMGARMPVEVPSVTTVLNVLDKSGALTWWGMKVGIEGVRQLCLRGLWDLGDVIPSWFALEVDEIVPYLTEHKLTVNHVKDKAADRGVNIHDALEAWCRHGVLPITEQYPETERGYVEGLNKFLTAIQHVAEVDGMEVMVGSLEHLYAGRFDLVLNLSKPVEVVTKTYPKRTDKVEEIPAGRYLLDLKTSKRVYDTHFLQLEAYEQAAVECGYKPTDYRGVVHVTEDGRYELSVNKEWQFEDFQVVRQAYSVMHERDRLRNEREILADLKALGAKEVA